MEETIKALKSALAEPKKAVILTHRNPDGDALGSSLAWGAYLQKKGIEVTLISPTFYTDNLNWLQGVKGFLVYDNTAHKPFADKAIETAELIFCLDFNALSRLEGVGQIVLKAAGKKILIDHHREPEDFAEIAFSNIAAGATSEMVYDIICALGDEDLIDQPIAENLYIGLATDVGFFQFSNTTPNVHRVAGALIAEGVSPEYIQDKINNVFSENRLRFFGFMLREKLRLTQGGKVAYMTLSKEEAKQFYLQMGDTEGLVNYPLKISNVEMAVFMNEDTDRIKMSFRSKKEMDVSEFARKYFDGGGHRNASGGRTFVTLEKTERLLLDALKEYLG